MSFSTRLYYILLSYLNRALEKYAPQFKFTKYRPITFKMVLTVIIWPINRTSQKFRNKEILFSPPLLFLLQQSVSHPFISCVCLSVCCHQQMVVIKNATSRTCQCQEHPSPATALPVAGGFGSLADAVLATDLQWLMGVPWKQG